MNFRQIAQRALAFFRKESWDRDFDAEAASHLDFAIEENIRSGMAPEEARRQALVRFGGVQQSREKHREARGLPWLDSVMQDLRYTFRTLRRDRGFALIAVLMLGLGIGANVAVFSVVDGILLRPLPFRNPGQLVWIKQGNKTTALSGLTYSADAYEEFRDRNRSFQSVTGYFAFTRPDNFRLTGHGQPLPATAIYVVGNFFRTLGVQPKMGRLFTAEECQKNGPSAVLISYPFWKRQFAGDPKIVGRPIDLNGKPVTVSGVLPKDFDFGSIFLPGETVDMFVPYILDDWRNDGNDLALIARLKPGVNISQAQTEANILMPDIYQNVKYPTTKGAYTMKLMALKQYVSGKLRRSLIVLWSAVGFILLIVCVNLSNLLLARAASRSKEFAMRAALGAGRWRLIRQLLTESLLLAAAGAVLGLGIAYAITTYLAHQGSIALPLLSSVRLDGVALAWTILIAALAAVLFGLLPGFRMSGGNVQASLKDMGHGISAGRSHQRLRSILVVSEIALACVLLIGAGLLLHSFLRLLDVDLGFRPSHAAVINVDYKGGNPQTRTAALHEILSRVQAIPGVQAAGIADNLPLEGNRSWNIRAKGKQYRVWPATFVYVITPGYFNAMGMRMLKGRQFNWHDGVHSQPVVILNERAAHSLWPGGDAVGRTALIDGKRTVIGVIADVHQSRLEGEPGLQAYLPVSQAGPSRAELVVRSKLPVSTLAPTLMRTLRSLNPEQPSTQLRSIQTDVDHAVSPRRFFVSLVSAFAAFGLLLAALGIFGVISYSVTQRTHEIGIRMALGATAGRVQANVLSQTLRLAVIGVFIGAIVSVVLARLIASLLFETAPTDPIAFAGTILLLGLTALVAGWL
ncbi:MAG: ADOP family duplicated permease, partial [Candidatus Acidiferrales bacterium]